MARDATSPPLLLTQHVCAMWLSDRARKARFPINSSARATPAQAKKGLDESRNALRVVLDKAAEERWEGEGLPARCGCLFWLPDSS